MKQKINNEDQLSLLKVDDIIYNEKDRWAVYINKPDIKELELFLVGDDLQANLHTREFKGTMSPLKKSYNAIIYDYNWETS